MGKIQNIFCLQATISLIHLANYMVDVACVTHVRKKK